MPVYYIQDNNNPNRAPFQVGEAFMKRHEGDPRFSVVSIGEPPTATIEVEPVKKKQGAQVVAIDPEYYNALNVTEARKFVQGIADDTALNSVLKLERLRNKPRKTIILAIEKRGIDLANV